MPTTTASATSSRSFRIAPQHSDGRPLGVPVTKSQPPVHQSFRDYRGLVQTGQRTAFAASEHLLNRELSWLDLNERVLDLAEDPNEPLLERVKLCSIFSTNLDEFFMVRVAGLLDQIVARLPVRSPDGRTPQETLAEIHERALDLTRRQSQLWRGTLCPALAAEGIVIGTVDDATDEEVEELEAG